MDYIVTRATDGDSLSHHGVKDMHWGEWNAETEARYAREHRGLSKRSNLKIQKLQSERDRTAKNVEKKSGVDKKTRIRNNVGIAAATSLHVPFLGASIVGGAALPGLIATQPLAAVPVAAMTVGSVAMSAIIEKGIKEVKNEKFSAKPNTTSPSKQSNANYKTSRTRRDTD